MEALESRQLLAATAAPADADSEYLTRRDVERILGRAGSQALNTQIIAVVDREGNVLGVYGGPNARNVDRRDKTIVDGKTPIPARTLFAAVTRARTAAFFQSTEDAFTTRTARFIIQDHFPHPVPNTPGGPLYGVQFSSLPKSDVLSGPAISGDPGGVPLYKNGVPVGGIGVAGDSSDVAAREDLLFLTPLKSNPQRKVFNGSEESDFDEAVALAGAAGLMAPESIRANEIFLDGLRLPFTAGAPASGKPAHTLDELISAGGTLRNPNTVEVEFFRNGSKTRGSPRTPLGREVADPIDTFAGVSGTDRFPIVGSSNAMVDESDRLTRADVRRIIGDAVDRGIHTRGAIREPLGVPARVHVAVVDEKGEILGVFRMQDGTNFSYDVAVQKARTAAFFSSDNRAFSTRAIGFVSQRFFPIGLEGASTGPLFGLQNQLSLKLDKEGDLAVDFRAPLKNGITIFPGGVPLYKNGTLVGAIGISGDGVDQDDIIAYSGSQRFAPPAGIRSDQLSGSAIIDHLRDKFDLLRDLTSLSLEMRVADRLKRLKPSDLDEVQLPYVKFPRDPEV